MEGLQRTFLDAVVAAFEAGEIRHKDDLHKVKQRIAWRLHMDSIPTDRDMSPQLPESIRTRFADVLRTKPIRTQSGVAVVAVMSAPSACPHGKCTFCPGGPDVGVPQSYTGFEPSTMRAIRVDYNPYKIVRGRLTQLAGNGHAIDKVDIVIQGGTFPAVEDAYQDWFVSGIMAGLNDGPGDGDWDSLDAWQVMTPEARQARLAALMQENESAACRCIGLTIETKPDWCLEPHLDGMLRRGATRVEIGIQTLDEDTLQLTHRGHTLEDTKHALQASRDAGFKIVGHLMPGLPRRRPAPEGATSQSPPLAGSLDPIPEMDIEDMRRLFAEPDWRPDMIKIYPCLVVEEGITVLKRQFQQGLYHPLDTAKAADVVAKSKPFVPSYCRIQRVDRDIPTTHVVGGVQNSNLRQIAQARMRELGLPACRCIRCREPAQRQREGHEVRGDGLELQRLEYEAGDGLEVFLSMEDPTSDAVVGFIRVRRVSTQAHRPEVQVPGGAAFVRELKVYGVAQRLHDDPETGAFQHQGLGARLLAEAERVAFSEWQCGRLLVIAGPGVKPYYRRHGYTDCGPYVAKTRPAAVTPATLTGAQSSTGPKGSTGPRASTRPQA